MVEEIKKWWQSKTVWFNGLMALSGIFALVAEYLNSGSFAQPEGWFLFGVGFVGIVLRIYFTNMPVEL